jgi:dipeptidase E
MKLILNGGGEGNQVKSARELLNNLIDHSKKILYIPLAWPNSDYDSCLEFMTNELYDVDCAGIEMVRSGEEIVNKNLSDYACIYIGGGNTYKLLSELKTSGAFDRIRDYLINEDGIVYGGSAGAIIFGKDLDSCNTDDDNEVGLIDNTGFDMLNGYSLLCHYTSRNEERTLLSKNYLLELSKIKPVYAIPEEDTIFIDDGKIEIIGYRSYYEFKGGEMNMKDIINLVPYTDEDYEFVYEVKKNAYKKYVKDCWGTWIEEDQRTYFEKFINMVKNNAYIILNGNTKIGFYNGEVLENGNYEIGNICIIPEYQGKGIGTKILKDKLEENKYRDIEIQYFKQNPVGALYERLGFIPNGETQFHYQMIKHKEDIKKVGNK